ncbi:MAG: hypothetical protein KBB37_03650 [Bacteroidia bacterium]|nr:hypothetical protein [Bacteroidia bacterium]MBP7260359.1 hypothetical protein [Bacteroidia bacterium]MBP9180150.1 hypothetical protein [Bacteroidia bacterium]MBP9725250.1 hypothetical protein [Bacteroidia bacterium]
MKSSFFISTLLLLRLVRVNSTHALCNAYENVFIIKEAKRGESAVKTWAASSYTYNVNPKR